MNDIYTISWGPNEAVFSTSRRHINIPVNILQSRNKLTDKKCVNTTCRIYIHESADSKKLLCEYTVACDTRDQYNQEIGCKIVFAKALKEARFTRQGRFEAWQAWQKYNGKHVFPEKMRLKSSRKERLNKHISEAMEEISKLEDAENRNKIRSR